MSGRRILLVLVLAALATALGTAVVVTNAESSDPAPAVTRPVSPCQEAARLGGLAFGLWADWKDAQHAHDPDAVGLRADWEAAEQRYYAHYERCVALDPTITGPDPR